MAIKCEYQLKREPKIPETYPIRRRMIPMKDGTRVPMTYSEVYEELHTVMWRSDIEKFWTECITEDEYNATIEKETLNEEGIKKCSEVDQTN